MCVCGLDLNELSFSSLNQNCQSLIDLKPLVRDVKIGNRGGPGQFKIDLERFGLVTIWPICLMGRFGYRLQFKDI